MGGGREGGREREREGGREGGERREIIHVLSIKITDILNTTGLL